MGAQSPPPWKPPHDAYTTLDAGYCKVWVRSRDRVEELEEYPVFIHSHEELQGFQDMFALRLNNPALVSVVYFTHKPGGLCQVFHTGSVLLQRIRYRLCQFSEFPQEDATSILYGALKSCRQLYNKFGLFKLSSTMIGFDNSWRIKIWHNTDLSSPNPENQYCRSVSEMIHHLIAAVQNLALPSHHQTFQEFVQQNRLSLFSIDKTIQYLQLYCQQHSIQRKQNFVGFNAYLESIENFENMYIQELQRNYLRKMQEGLANKSKYQQIPNKIQKYDKSQESESSMKSNNSKSKYSFKSKSVIKYQPRQERRESPCNLDIKSRNKIQTFQISEYFDGSKQLHGKRPNELAGQTAKNNIGGFDREISQRFQGRITQTTTIKGNRNQGQTEEVSSKRPPSTTARNSSYHSLDHSVSNRSNKNQSNLNRNDDYERYKGQAPRKEEKIWKNQKFKKPCIITRFNGKLLDDHNQEDGPINFFDVRQESKSNHHKAIVYKKPSLKEIYPSENPYGIIQSKDRKNTKRPQQHFESIQSFSFSQRSNPHRNASQYEKRKRF